MSTIQQFEEAAAKAMQASAQADTWANGPEGVFVDTASGPVPTIAEFNREAASRVKGTSEAGTCSLPLPDPATLGAGATVVLTGTFAADVTSVLLTVDFVKGVKSWTGTVISANDPVNADGLPDGVTWISDAMIKVNGSYVSGVTQYIKSGGVYTAVTQYIKSGGVYVGPGGSQEKLRVATGLNLLPSARTTKGYTNAFFRFPLEIVGGNKKYLVAGFNNFYRTTDTNSPIVSTGNSLTIVRAAIESTTTAAYMPITFNGGSESITLPELATAILSDEIHPDGLGLESFSNLSKYWVRIEARIPTASGFWPLNTPNYNYTGQNISYYDPAATTLVNGAYSTGALTTSGVAPSNGSTGVCPIWLGEPVDALQDKSFVVMGSSVEWGVSDREQWNIGGASGMGYINRALRTAECPNLNLAIPGATTMTLELYGQYITPWLKYGRYMFDGIGSNDISGLRSAAEINASLQARYVQLGTVGYKKMIRNSLGMRTTSTDSWATPEKQTYYSGWGPGSKADEVKQFMDAGVANGLYDYITSTPSYRDANDPWKWKTNGAANYPTTDGTHPKNSMHILMATDIAVAIQQAMSA